MEILLLLSLSNFNILKVNGYLFLFSLKSKYDLKVSEDTWAFSQNKKLIEGYFSEIIYSSLF